MEALAPRWPHVKSTIAYITPVTLLETYTSLSAAASNYSFGAILTYF